MKKMRKNYNLQFLKISLRRKFLLVFAVLSLAAVPTGFSQTIIYAFANAQITNDGVDTFYEADIVLTTDTDFALGAGQFYLDYNTLAFGSSIEGGNLTFTHPEGSSTSYVLDERIFGGAFDGYAIVNANSSTSKLSISWSTTVANQVSTNITVAGSPNLICHIKIKYLSTGLDESPNLSFDTTTSPDAVNSFGLTFTDGGTQLTNDSYDSTGSEPCVLWDGSTDSSWDTASNWGSNSVPTSDTNVMIPTNQTIVAPGNISVKNLDIEAGAALTVSGNISPTGEIRVKSGASLIAQNSSAFTLRYDRSLSTTNWYLVSSGVVNETVEDLISNHSFATGTGSNIGVGDYNNTTPGWTYSTLSSTGTIASGEGRAIKLSTSGDVSFTGDMPSSDVSITISDGSGSGGNGFNLIGNPFPSYLPANETVPTVSNNLLRANTSILNQETIWVWDQSTDSYAAINQASALIDGIRYIPPGQGFFVQSTSSGGSFTFAESMQSHQTTDNFSRSLQIVPKVKLVMSGANIEKESNVVYLSSATKGWDNGFDSTLFDGANTSFAIYTHLVSDSSGQNLEIQSLPDSDYEMMIVPIGVDAVSGTQISIGADVSGFPEGVHVYLEDRETNRFTRVDTPDQQYTVTLSGDSQGIGRFYLHTTSKVLSTTSSEELENVSAYQTTPNNLRVVGIHNVEVTAELFSILGNQVLSSEFTGRGVNDIPLSKLPTGIYLLRLETEVGKLTKKIVIEY